MIAKCEIELGNDKFQALDCVKIDGKSLKTIMRDIFREGYRRGTELGEAIALDSIYQTLSGADSEPCDETQSKTPNSEG